MLNYIYFVPFRFVNLSSLNVESPKVVSLSYRMMNIASAGTLHLHVQASSYLSTFQAHGSISCFPVLLCWTPLTAAFLAK
jgi:hypothetical protein